MRTLTLVAAFVIGATSLSTAGSAHAQEVQITGPLAGAPATIGMRQYRLERFQIQPFFGFTLQDEFARTMPIGILAQYHFTDWLGVGLWGMYGGIQFDTDLTSQVARQGQTTDRNRLNLPRRENFSRQIAHIDWGIMAQVTFIPLRGKLSLFQRFFLDADFFVFAGIGATGTSERASVSRTPMSTPERPVNVCYSDVAGGVNRPACEATQLAREGQTNFAFTFGAGLTVYANQWFGVSLEYRALPFTWNTGGFDVAGLVKNGGNFPDGQIDGSDRGFYFNHMFSIGAVFYLPTQLRVSQ